MSAPARRAAPSTRLHRRALAQDRAEVGDLLYRPGLLTHAGPARQNRRGGLTRPSEGRDDQQIRAMLHARGVEGIRVLQGLLALSCKHPANSLEKACETALSHGEFHLRTLRKLIERSAPVQTPLPFLEEHPIIRPLADYARLVQQAIHRQEDRSSGSEGFTRHDWAKERPGEQRTAGRGAAEVPPPRPGYPSPGCPSAEPGSVSPDNF